MVIRAPVPSKAVPCMTMVSPFCEQQEHGSASSVNRWAMMHDASAGGIGMYPWAFTVNTQGAGALRSKRQR